MTSFAFVSFLLTSLSMFLLTFFSSLEIYRYSEALVQSEVV